MTQPIQCAHCHRVLVDVAGRRQQHHKPVTDQQGRMFCTKDHLQLMNYGISGVRGGFQAQRVKRLEAMEPVLQEMERDPQGMYWAQQIRKILLQSLPIIGAF